MYYFSQRVVTWVDKNENIGGQNDKFSMESIVKFWDLL